MSSTIQTRGVIMVIASICGLFAGLSVTGSKAVVAPRTIGDSLDGGFTGDNRAQRFDPAAGRPAGAFVAYGSAGLLGPMDRIFAGADSILANQDATPGESRRNPALVSHHSSAQLAATPTPSDDPVLVGAGDIASTKSRGDDATANLLDTISGTVFTLGDDAYELGSSADFQNGYDPTWGRQKSRTRPTAGNHEYKTTGASGYFSYFGAAAGDAGKGYYSYDLGAWHIVVLNSNCTIVECQAGAPQEQWLKDDLAAHPAVCTLAMWHHPRFTSGTKEGPSLAVQPFWDDLYQARADVVLSGHEHNYERFAPQTPTGAADPTNGIREFVVGTGGRSLFSLGPAKPNSEVRNSNTYGVLSITLHSSSYDWQFIPVAGSSFTDSGTSVCH